MFNKSLFDNSRADGFPVLEVAAERPDGSRQFVPLRRSELLGEVSGPLTDLRLVQTFGYSAEQCEKTLEALYRFPLPGDAAVTGVTVRFGDVEIRAELKERERAEADYEEAKRLGQQAAVATRESPDVFTLRVAGLQPDQEIRVETAYVQLARMEAEEWTLRVPLTTSPRYIREDEAHSRHAQGQPLALLRDPGHRFSLDLRIQNAGSVTSATHVLATVAEDDGLRVRLNEGEVLPDRDCVLNWRLAQELQHPALHLHLYEDRAEKAVYFLALIAPPAHQPEHSVGQVTQTSVPREAILLVDHSGSMHGPKWEAADWAVKQFLNGLQPHDTFALGFFHNSTRWFADKPRRADAATVSAAIEFLKQNKDSGGTQLGVALEQALSQKRTSGEVSRHVLILTDAEVSDAGRILRLADMESERGDRRRISVLCIDAAPNSLLARELAVRGGGTAKFLTSQPEEEDITTALDRILEDWSAPLLTGLRLEVNRAGAEAVGRKARLTSYSRGTAIDIGDLPAGRAFWVAGRVPRGDSPDLAFRLLTADGREIAARRCDLESSDATYPAVKSLFGASRVLALEFLTTGYYDDDQIRDQLKRLGYDPTVLTEKPDRQAIYAENVQRNAREGLKALLVRESLHYGLASSETAFVAVRREPGKPVEETAAVANALPAGWSEAFLSGGRVLRLAKRQRSMSSGVMAPAADSALSRELYSLSDAFRSAPSGPRSRNVLQSAIESPVHSIPLFMGAPAFTGRDAVLFDTSRAEDGPKLVGARTFTRLVVRLQKEARDTASDPGLSILVYIDDLASPRARVRLADLLKQGGFRPLNLRRSAGQVVRIVLQDDNGVWSGGAPVLEVRLE